MPNISKNHPDILMDVLTTLSSNITEQKSSPNTLITVKMKKIPIWIIVVLVLVILMASKFLFFPKKDDKAGAANKSKAGLPIDVNYHVAYQSDIKNNLFVTGKIGAINQIDIVPEASGKIIAIYFKEGESINKGSLLIKLNDADLQAQLLKATTQLQLSEQKLTRLKKLLLINGVSQEEHDAQENDVNGLKADQAYIHAQIAKTTIVAPFAGVVGLKNISEGSFVNSNTPVVSLVQLSPLYVEFSVPEKYAGVLKKGVNINFLSENSGKQTNYTAMVYAIEPRIDETTKTIKARALYQGNQTFYPGSFVNVLVNFDEIKDAIMIPTPAVIPTLKGQKVMVCKNGVAVDVMVTIGVRTDEQIQIVEGINAGDTVVTTGLLSIKKDSKLKLLKPGK